MYLIRFVLKIPLFLLMFNFRNYSQKVQQKKTTQFFTIHTIKIIKIGRKFRAIRFF